MTQVEYSRFLINSTTQKGWDSLLGCNDREGGVSEMKFEPLAPDGLGYGDGDIGNDSTLNKRLLSELSRGEYLVDCSGSFLDSGCDCPDGRPSKDHKGNLPKIFGGSALMVKLGLYAKAGRVPTPEEVIDCARINNIGIAAHTGPTSDESKCGCGAIDNQNIIPTKVEEYSDNIQHGAVAILNMLGVDFSAQEYLEANRGVNKYSLPNDHREPAEELGIYETEGNAIVIEREGSHKEALIVLNFAPNRTLNLDEIAEKYSDSQVFCVDIWALSDLSKILAINDNDEFVEANFKKILYTMLIYSLGTAATLTNGKIPVYTVTYQNSEIL